MRITLTLLISFFLIGTVQSQDLPTVPVTTKPLSEVLIERRLTANASVTSLNNSQISAEVTSVVMGIGADIGDEVSAGDLLISLDQADYKLQLDSAKANTLAAQARLKQAQLRLDRAKELKTFISTDDLLGRETEVAVLKADLQGLKVAEKMAQRTLGKTQIEAAFDGIVTARQAQLGQLLSPGMPVLNLVQTAGLEIQALVPSHLSEELSAADRYEFVSQNKSTAVELIKLTDVVSQQAGLQTARFSMRKSESLKVGQLKVGQSGQLVWYLKDQLLSADLVVKRGGKLGVFIAKDQKAQFMPLPNAQEGRPVPLEMSTNGTENWQVIIGGRDRLQDGQGITVK